MCFYSPFILQQQVLGMKGTRRTHLLCGDIVWWHLAPTSLSCCLPCSLTSFPARSPRSH